MKSLRFFTGKDGEWRMKIDDSGEVVEASGSVSDWIGGRLDPAAVAERRRPIAVSGRRFPRLVDLILDLSPVIPLIVMPDVPLMFESPPCRHLSAPTGKAGAQ